MSEGRRILPQHILVEMERKKEMAPQSFREGPARAVAAFERVYVEEMLRKHGGNITRAARAAKKERRSFGRLVKKYGIDARNL